MSGKRRDTHAPALTVWEPWGTAIVRLGKDVENRRTWNRRYRGRMFIHAAARPAASSDCAQVAWLSGAAELPELRPGHVLGSVDLFDVCTPEDCRCSSRWGERGMFHLRLRDPQPVDRLWPVRGQQGLWMLYTGGTP